MIRIKLKEAIQDFERRFGGRMTYARLSRETGLAKATIESIGGRDGYNATLETVDKLCSALKCSPSDLLERDADADGPMLRKASGR